MRGASARATSSGVPAVRAASVIMPGSAERALALGYDGKWVIHPDQIATVNALFTPSPDAVARARSILAATDGASALEGEMVDAATKRLAESVLARASEL